MATDGTGLDGDGTTPEEAFNLVGNEVRVEIIRTLADAHELGEPPPTLSFSELYDRMDTDVATSQFSYHLDRLMGHFVARTDEGYRLRREGTMIDLAIKGGTFTSELSVDPFEAGFDCYFCEVAVVAFCDDEMFRIECPDCSRVYKRVRLPPKALQIDDRQELLSRVDLAGRVALFPASHGHCHACAESLENEFVPAEEAWLPGADQVDLYVFWWCENCWTQMYMTVGSTLIHRTPVITFCKRRGVDVISTPTWEFEFAATDRYLEIESTDPWRVSLEIHLDGDVLELLVDEDVNIVEETVY